MSGTAEVSAKRYRYTGKEKDEETGLYYHGARYYAPWLGRWTAADPAGLVDGLNLYRYSRDNPVRFSDPSGTVCSDGQSAATANNGFGCYEGSYVDPETNTTILSFNDGYRTNEINTGTLIIPDTVTATPKQAEEKDPKPAKEEEKEPPVPPKGSPDTTAPTQNPEQPTAGDASPGQPESPGASSEEAAIEFAKGVGEGLATGIATGVVLGALGPIGIGIGIGLAVYGAYGLATGGAEELLQSGQRIASGEGTPEDFNQAGNLVGGALSGRLRGGKGGGGRRVKDSTPAGGGRKGGGGEGGGGKGKSGSDDILFSQKRAAQTFSEIGSEASPAIRGRKIVDVADDLRTGKVSPDEIPIEFFVLHGRRITVNNRGLAALRLAGKEPTILRQVKPTQKQLNRLKESGLDGHHPVPGERLPITENKDGSGHLFTVF